MQRVSGIDDGQVMLEEFAGHVTVSRLIDSKFQRHAQHVAAIKDHPSGCIGLIEPGTIQQRLVAIEDSDVVQA